MAELSSFGLTKFLTDLINRPITVADASEAGAGQKVYARYEVLPAQTSVLLSIDLATLGSLGGLLAGIPEAVVKTQLAQRSLDDILADAMREILNITASLLGDGSRAVLRDVEFDAARGEALRRAMVAKLGQSRHFNLKLPSGVLGRMTVNIA